MPIRTPAQILEAVAFAQQYVTPLQEHMPVSPAMARACVRDAYAEALEALARAGSDRGALQRVRDELARASMILE